jgi:para-nitrobenzyl esterase
MRKQILRAVRALVVAITAAAIIGSADHAAAGAAPGPVIVTDRGAVRGLLTVGMRSFLGIPYAAAPVGTRRWAPPAPHTSWVGVRPATTFARGCPQGASLLAEASTDEDCLYLNVFTPTGDDGKPWPAMVWIHGGGLVSGDASSYLPDRLVAQGVVVVTLDYRLGVLGFLAHPALATGKADRASGNYGLLDQQYALRWVQHNIAAFGGNPHEVTLFGQSAGGLSVHDQLASPEDHGLFQRAIVESGGYSGSQPTLNEAEATGEAFAARVGCRAQTAVCLRRVPVAALLAAQPSFEVTPVVDGRFLTQPITAAFATGRFVRVPVIEGSTRNEFRFFVATGGLAGILRSRYRQAISATLGVAPSTAGAIAERYPPGGYPSPSVALAAAATDADYACRALAAARALARFVPTYQYEFADEGAPRFFPGAPTFPLGAYHAAELQYLFTLRGVPSQLTGSHDDLSEAMLSLWAQFARTGTPGTDWPRVRPADPAVELLTPPTPSVATGFAAEHHCSFWEPLLR